MNENKNYFESADLSLVAALTTMGYSIEVVDKTNKSRVVFHILRDRGLDELVQAFWSHSITVDPLTYFNCLKEIKTRLYHSD